MGRRRGGRRWVVWSCEGRICFPDDEVLGSAIIPLGVSIEAMQAFPCRSGVRWLGFETQNHFLHTLNQSQPLKKFDN